MTSHRQDDAPIDVVVVGAGITGLGLCRELTVRDVPCVVLEARPEPGGVIRSERVEGRVLDLGPQRTRLVDPVKELVGELGLTDRVIEAPRGLPLFVYRAGALRRAPRSIRGLLSTDLLSGRGKIRLLAEPLTGSVRSEESVAETLVRKLGQEAYDHLAGPLYGGIYGSDPREMPVRYSLAPALERLGVGRSLLVAARRRLGAREELPAACSFRDGMRELTDALYEAHRDRVRLGAPVRGLRRSDGGDWELDVAGGSAAAGDPARPVTARRVILTTPADASARLLRHAAPGAADRLSRLRYHTLAVVHLLSECDLEGYGYQVSFAEEMATRGVTWNASLFGRDGVYTAYVGGGRGAPDFVTAEADDARLRRIASEEFLRVTGCPGRAIRSGKVRMPAHDRSWTALEGLELPDRLHLCANYLARPGIPGRLEDAARVAAEVAAEPAA